MNKDVRQLEEERNYYKRMAERYKNETYDLHTWAVFATVGLVGIILVDLIAATIILIHTARL